VAVDSSEMCTYLPNCTVSHPITINSQFIVRYLDGNRCKVVSAYTMKAYQRSEGTALLNLNRSSRQSSTISLTPRHFTPGK